MDNCCTTHHQPQNLLSIITIISYRKPSAFCNCVFTNIHQLLQIVAVKNKTHSGQAPRNNYFYLAVCVAVGLFSIVLTCCWHSEQLVSITKLKSLSVFLFVCRPVFLTYCWHSEIFLSTFALTTMLKSWKTILHSFLLFHGQLDMAIYL